MNWNVSEEEYRAYPAVNFHTLARFHRDPKAFKENAFPEETESDAMRFGAAFHSKLLTPEKPLQVFNPPINPKTGEPYGSTSKAYQEARAKLDGLVVTQRENDLIERMTNEFRLHPEAPRLFDHVIAIEQPVRGVVDTPLGEVEIKGRIDALTSRGIVDVKTTSSFDDATGHDRFRRAIYDYKYIVQLAFYQRLMTLNGSPTLDCWILAFEKTEPCRVAVYYITQEVMENAQRVVDGWLYEWRRAQNGEYKSRYDDVQTIEQYDFLKDL